MIYGMKNKERKKERKKSVRSLKHFSYNLIYLFIICLFIQNSFQMPHCTYKFNEINLLYDPLKSFCVRRV